MFRRQLVWDGEFGVGYSSYTKCQLNVVVRKHMKQSERLHTVINIFKRMEMGSKFHMNIYWLYHIILKILESDKLLLEPNII